MDFARKIKDFALDLWDSGRPFRLVIGLFCFIFYLLILPFCWFFEGE